MKINEKLLESKNSKPVKEEEYRHGMISDLVKNLKSEEKTKAKNPKPE